MEGGPLSSKALGDLAPDHALVCYTGFIPPDPSGFGRETVLVRVRFLLNGG
jgi:hypothetical protein